MRWQLRSPVRSQKHMLNVVFRIIVILCVGIRWFYWKKTEKMADKEKPKKKGSMLTHVSQLCWLAIAYIPFLQILGLNLFRFHSLLSQIFGLMIVVGGTIIALWARKILGTNWANGYEYQVKEKQELITTNIYSVVRHPIYLGLTLVLIGMELVAQSYLWISYLGLLIVFYLQAKREEKNFLAHFGKKYQEYMYHTKMFIPYIL